MAAELHPVPWSRPAVPDAQTYLPADLARLAQGVADGAGGRLLDWRIVVGRKLAYLETRYLLEDGIARHRLTPL